MLAKFRISSYLCSAFEDRGNAGERPTNVESRRVSRQKAPRCISPRGYSFVDEIGQFVDYLCIFADKFVSLWYKIEDAAPRLCGLLICHKPQK